MGAGAVGPIARALSESRECLVIDSEMAIGQGVSSRNSEVIHAGIYYPTASLKAELCVRGKHYYTSTVIVGIFPMRDAES